MFGRSVRLTCRILCVKPRFTARLRLRQFADVATLFDERPTSRTSWKNRPTLVCARNAPWLCKLILQYRRSYCSFAPALSLCSCSMARRFGYRNGTTMKYSFPSMGTTILFTPWPADLFLITKPACQRGCRQGCCFSLPFSWRSSPSIVRVVRIG